MLRDNSHHAVWVEQRALRWPASRRAGPAGAGSAPDRATGLHEEEMDLVAVHVPAETLDEQVAGLLEAQRYLHSLGVTGWQDAIVGAYAGHQDPTRPTSRSPRAGC